MSQAFPVPTTPRSPALALRIEEESEVQSREAGALPEVPQLRGDQAGESPTPRLMCFLWCRWCQAKGSKDLSTLII